MASILSAKYCMRRAHVRGRGKRIGRFSRGSEVSVRRGFELIAESCQKTFLGGRRSHGAFDRFIKNITGTPNAREGLPGFAVPRVC